MARDLLRSGITTVKALVLRHRSVDALQVRLLLGGVSHVLWQKEEGLPAAAPAAAAAAPAEVHAPVPHAGLLGLIASAEAHAHIELQRLQDGVGGGDEGGGGDDDDGASHGSGAWLSDGDFVVEPVDDDPPADLALPPPLHGGGEAGPPAAGGGEGEGEAAPPAAGGPGWGHGAPGAPLEHFDIPGYGSLVYSRGRLSFGAHCACGHGLCRTNRTVRPRANRPEQGRCLGVLVAWLIAGAACDDFESHQALARRAGRYDPAMSRVRRQEARAWLRSLPGSAWLFLEERALAEGQDEEPEHIPY